MVVIINHRKANENYDVVLFQMIQGMSNAGK